MPKQSIVEVEVLVCQRRYRLQCSSDEVESLQQSAQALNDYMEEMSASLESGIVGNEKLAIAVAINLIGSVSDQERRSREIDDRIGLLSQSVHNCLDQTA